MEQLQTTAFDYFAQSSHERYQEGYGFHSKEICLHLLNFTADIMINV